MRARGYEYNACKPKPKENEQLTTVSDKHHASTKYIHVKLYDEVGIESDSRKKAMNRNWYN